MVALDHRGHGRGIRSGARSGWRTAPTTWPRWPTCSASTASSPVGYSMGGPVAMLAVAAPPRARRRPGAVRHGPQLQRHAARSGWVPVADRPGHGVRGSAGAGPDAGSATSSWPAGPPVRAVGARAGHAATTGRPCSRPARARSVLVARLDRSTSTCPTAVIVTDPRPRRARPAASCAWPSRSPAPTGFRRRRRPRRVRGRRRSCSCRRCWRRCTRGHERPRPSRCRRGVTAGVPCGPVRLHSRRTADGPITGRRRWQRPTAGAVVGRPSRRSAARARRRVASVAAPLDRRGQRGAASGVRPRRDGLAACACPARGRTGGSPSRRTPAMRAARGASGDAPARRRASCVRVALGRAVSQRRLAGVDRAAAAPGGTADVGSSAVEPGRLVPAGRAPQRRPRGSRSSRTRSSSLRWSMPRCVPTAGRIGKLRRRDRGRDRRRRTLPRSPGPRPRPRRRSARPGARVRRSIGPETLTAADDRAGAVADGRRHRRHARLALLDRLRPTRPAGTGPTRSTRPGRAPVERQDRADRHDPPQPVGRLERLHAQPAVARRARTAARSRPVSSRSRSSTGRAASASGKRRRRRPPEADQARGPSAKRPSPSRRTRPCASSATARRCAVARGRPWPPRSSARPSGRAAASRASRTATALSSTPTPLTVGSTRRD